MTDVANFSPTSDAGKRLQSAFGSSDWDATADIVEREWADLMTADSDLLKTVLRALPAEVMQSRPRLALASNYVSYLPVDGQTRTEIFRASAPAGTATSLLDVLAELTSRAASKRSSGDFDRAAADAQRARAAFAAASEAEIDTMRSALPELHYQWALALDLAGDLAGGVREYTESYDRAVMAGNLPIQTQAAGAVAFVHALSGRRSEAERWLTRVPPEADTSWSSRTHVRALLATALLAIRALDLEAAFAALDRLGPVNEKPEFWASRLYVRCLAARGTADCTALLAEIDSAVAARPAAMSTTGVPGALVTLARAELLLKRGSIARGRAVLDAEPLGSSYTVASARLLSARTSVLSGRYTEAASTLDRFADELAVHPVLQAEALYLRALINSSAQYATQAFDLASAQSVFSALASLSPSHLDEVAALLERAPAEVDVARVASATNVVTRIDPLTPQELVVLNALAVHNSVRDAAAALYLSLNTVKSHLRRIYLKLDVNSKDEAIAVGANYGLLRD